MTLLGHQDGADHLDGVGYLDIAGLIIQYSPAAREDLEQLWRRMVFNILVSNTDDHLRNHGFMLTSQGWRLSPAFDMNPNEMGNGLTLNISESSNEQDVLLAMETARLYQLKKEKAEVILNEIQLQISSWRAVAKKYGISNSEMDQTKRAFRLVDGV
jgi:serine/threonine-protein kinase HipA